MNALLQCLFALPLPDNFQTSVGSTQDLLRLATHPSFDVRSVLAFLVRTKLSTVMSSKNDQRLEQGRQHDPAELLQILVETGPTDCSLSDVFRFESSEQMVNCHCGSDHKKQNAQRFCIELPIPSCNCGKSSKCKCILSVKSASKVNNATAKVPDYLCPSNSQKGLANRKYAGPEASGSPKVAVVVQMRGKKVCSCVDFKKCNHVVTSIMHPNPHSQYSFFRFFISLNTLFSQNLPWHARNHRCGRLPTL
jgi:hypothetical protein